MLLVLMFERYYQLGLRGETCFAQVDRKLETILSMLEE